MKDKWFIITVILIVILACITVILLDKNNVNDSININSID